MTEEEKMKNEEKAESAVTKIMARNNPKWRQKIKLSDNIIVETPKPFAFKKLFTHKSVNGWKFEEKEEEINNVLD